MIFFFYCAIWAMKITKQSYPITYSTGYSHRYRCSDPKPQRSTIDRDRSAAVLPLLSQCAWPTNWLPINVNDPQRLPINYRDLAINYRDISGFQLDIVEYMMDLASGNWLQFAIFPMAHGWFTKHGKIFHRKNYESLREGKAPSAMSRQTRFE